MTAPEPTPTERVLVAARKDFRSKRDRSWERAVRCITRMPGGIVQHALAINALLRADPSTSNADAAFADAILGERAIATERARRADSDG